MFFIDIHCHILPGLDDGAFSADDSVQMAQIASSGLTAAIVCTPHASADSGCDREEFITAFSGMKELLAGEGNSLRLFAGHEIFVAGNAADAVENLRHGRLFSLAGSRYVLAEFDPFESSDAVFGAVSAFTSAGYVPVIAHPERYEFFAEDPDAARRLHSKGALLQMNKGSITGFFGEDAQECAQYLISARLADFVASDAHSPFVRTPYLRDAHEWICENCSPRYADHLFRDNPGRIIKNEKIYPYRSAR